MRSLHIEENGTGPDVVLLHGTPSSPGDFGPLAARLASRHRVLVPHLPGYGRTPPQIGSYSLTDVIDRLKTGLAEHKVREAAWVAFSGGAYKAVTLALDANPIATRMVLLSPLVGLDPEAAAAFRAIAAAVRAGAFDPRPTWLERMARPGCAQAHPRCAQQVLAWLDAVPTPVLCDELVAAADAPDLRERIRELVCPILVCAGTEDRAVPPAASEALAASCRNGKFARIEGAGHAALVEDFDSVARLIENFLDDP